MQNCLHSRKRVKMFRALVLFAIVLIAVVLSVISSICVKPDGDAPRSNAPVYLSVKAESTPEIKKNDSKQEELTVQKMNNEINKNAKIYDCAEITPSQNIITPDTVKVKFGEGIVRQMPTEQYILGCVLGEMPLYFESQALMAQSVAVRSFTYRRILHGTTKHPEAHVCTDYRCCQSYVSPDSVILSDENREKLSNAVNSTRGIVAVYEGEPIEAAYHASSGECTLDSEQVWGGKVEYPRSVKSPEGETEIYENGYGHRVGMSQHGANILAGQGKSYIDIIKYYYSGVSLSFM